MIEDLPRHKGQRTKLVKKLIAKGIRNKDVLKAIGRIPRHAFLDSSFEDFAYQDKPFPIASDQTISQPYTVAFQTELLEPQKGDRIMEVGTGSGYQAAVLLEMGVKVYSVERHKELHEFSKKILRNIGYNPVLAYGDGYKGMPTYAPFDGIVVTAGAPEVPEALKEQLKPGGKLVIPVGKSVQKMKRYTRLKDGSLEEEDFGDFRFVPLLGERNV